MFSFSKHTLRWVEALSALSLSHQKQDEVWS
ncbi:hypothetical protein F901_02933 [Acinetobacter dispersus]|nr:hypothetical protein F901_02933 [Acinetobacter dispersus]